MHWVFFLPLASDCIIALNSVENTVSVIASNEVEDVTKSNNCKSTPIFVHWGESRPLFRHNVVDFWIINSFFSFFASKNVDLFIVGNWTKFRSIGVELAHFLPVKAEQIEFHYTIGLFIESSNQIDAFALA